MINQPKEQQQSVDKTSPPKICSNATKVILWSDSEHMKNKRGRNLQIKRRKCKIFVTSKAPQKKSKESSSSAWIGYNKDEDEASALGEDTEANAAKCCNDNQQEEKQL
jgi:hypothetical protein